MGKRSEKFGEVEIVHATNGIDGRGVKTSSSPQTTAIRIARKSIDNDVNSPKPHVS